MSPAGQTKKTEGMEVEGLNRNPICNKTRARKPDPQGWALKATVTLPLCP